MTSSRRSVSAPIPWLAPPLLLLTALAAPACEHEEAGGPGAMLAPETLATEEGSPMAGIAPTEDPSEPAPPAAKETGATPVIKFCHRLVAGGQPIELELRIGPVSLKATSNTCAPARGQPCLALAAGRHHVTLLRGDKVLTEGPLDVAPGQNLIAYAEMNKNKKDVDVNVIAAKTAAACAATVKPRAPAPPPPPPGSVTCWAEGTYRVCDGAGGFCQYPTVSAFGFGATRIEAETRALVVCGDHMTSMIIVNNFGSSSASGWFPCHITRCF